MPVVDIIKLRNDTAANWTSINPVLLQGELGVELGTGGEPPRFKIGNQAGSHWNDLPYVEIRPHTIDSYAPGTIQRLGTDVAGEWKMYDPDP